MSAEFYTAVYDLLVSKGQIKGNAYLYLHL